MKHLLNNSFGGNLPLKALAKDREENASRAGDVPATSRRWAALSRYSGRQRERGRIRKDSPETSLGAPFLSSFFYSPTFFESFLFVPSATELPLYPQW